jgi:hypothetical protein
MDVKLLHSVWKDFLDTVNTGLSREGTPLNIPPLTYIVNKKIIKNPNEFSG